MYLFSSVKTFFKRKRDGENVVVMDEPDTVFDVSRRSLTQSEIAFEITAFKTANIRYNRVFSWRADLVGLIVLYKRNHLFTRYCFLSLT